jgi:hypothetical protein
MKPKNIKEFKKLIERYETIMLQEIKDACCNKRFLTGFGSIYTCTLCASIDLYCVGCVYGSRVGCVEGVLEESYDRIRDAYTPVKLKNAYRNRAKVLRQYAKDNNIKI